MSAAPGCSQVSSHRSTQSEGIPASVLPPLQALRHSASLPLTDFRLAMRRLVGAVSIVTTLDGTTPAGLTATAVTSFSAEPARLLACINLKGTSFRAIAESRRMAINLLAYHHAEIAKQFGGAPVSHEARFGLAQWGTLVTGAPVLLDALAVFDCVVDEMMVAHSHAVIIGEIKAVLISPHNNAPLLYGDGQFTTLQSHIEKTSP
jgi:flavin reductase (DIM6/NTAB) family NADH-FMN oxidoreductase RutF